MRFPSLRRALTAVLVLVAANSTHAMSVLAPTFDELVSSSGEIVRATVVSTEPVEAVTKSGVAVIKTRVTWKVEGTLKGNQADTLTLDLLGGTRGDTQLKVPGMPEFQVGDSDYLFVGKNRAALVPLVAAGHGRYPISRDSGTGNEVVLRADFTPLRSTNEVKEDLGETNIQRSSLSGAITTAEFEAAVKQRVSLTEKATQ